MTSFVLACSMVVGVFSGISLEASASSLSELQKKSQETQEAIDSMLEEKEAAQEEAEALNDQEEEAEATYSAYATQLANIQSQIATAEEAIASSSEEMATLSQELEEAYEAEQAQYASMCARIQYLYENESQTSVLVAILESGSISEFLNRMEKIAAILTYDREMLLSYQELQETIASKSEALAAKQEELLGYQDVLNDSRSQMDALAEAAGDALADISADADAANSKVEDYEEQLAALEAQKASLDAQAASAQASLAKSIATQQAAQEASGTTENTSQARTASDTELKLLAACIQAEADNQSYQGKLAVGSVIMNRVNSSLFPNTITGVITQSGQFASYPSLINFILDNGGPNSTCLSVAQEVLAGARNGDWLFFMTEYYAKKFGITGYTKIGDHVFFKKWGANETSSTTVTDQSSGTSSDSSATTDSSTSTTTDGSSSSTGSDSGSSTADGGSTDSGTSTESTTDTGT